MTSTTDIDPARLDAFVGRFAGDLGAVLHTATVLVGDRLGLYRAMADGAPVTPDELAERTGTDRRMVAEWLAAQAASQYVEYDSETATFRLPAEHAFALTDEHNPIFVPGGLQVAASTLVDVPLVADAMAGAGAVDWGEHHHDLFEGTERFFRPNYIGGLVSQWLPALDGVEDKLRAGATVADVGCGHGASTILMAQAFPASTFVGFDFHERSVAAASKAAADAGVGDSCRFAVAAATDFPADGQGYDLVCWFDSFHDLGDPLGAARHTRDVLAADGTVLLVEPRAEDRLEDNLNPVGRIFYSCSTTLCVPASQAQPVGTALGAQAGEGRLRAIFADAGLGRFRRAAETPFNIVLEARA